jgi:hypothetical protein
MKKLANEIREKLTKDFHAENIRCIHIKVVILEDIESEKVKKFGFERIFGYFKNTDTGTFGTDLRWICYKFCKPQTFDTLHKNIEVDNWACHIASLERAGLQYRLDVVVYKEKDGLECRDEANFWNYDE